MLLSTHRRTDAAATNSAFVGAVRYGHVRVVHFLLQLTAVNPAFRRDEAIRAAVSRWNGPMVKLLLEDGRVHVTGEVFENAATTGSAEVKSSYGKRSLVLRLRRKTPREAMLWRSASQQTGGSLRLYAATVQTKSCFAAMPRSCVSQVTDGMSAVPSTVEEEWEGKGGASLGSSTLR